MDRYWSKVRKADGEGCWAWTASRTREGYGQFHLDGKMRLAHRVVWVWTFGRIPDGLDVLHKCDNPSCVNPVHLFLGTHSDNMQDMTRKGRHPRNRGQAKLTPENVTEMRRLFKTGKFTQKALADKFKVTKGNAGFILREETWKGL